MSGLSKSKEKHRNEIQSAQFKASTVTDPTATVLFGTVSKINKKGMTHFLTNISIGLLGVKNYYINEDIEM